MAAQIVGEAFLSSLFGKLFDTLGLEEYLNFFRGSNFNEQSLRKLKITLCSANQVLDDAGLQQFTTQNAREWLFDLKEAICVAEELLYDINYEILRYEVESKSGSSFKRLKSSFSSSCTTFDRAIEEILERLEYIVKSKDLHGLKQGVKSIASQRLPAPLADESSVYGRDDDKLKIMELLRADNGSSSNKISVIPITGMGGVGKTTLAQLVYDEESVKSQFVIRSWVTVSDDSTLSMIAKRILDQITPGKCQIEEPNQLQREVKEALRDKMFLLVLDDVWDESCAHVEALMSCFHSGARGSWIIVTTRSETVARNMGTVPAHPLKTVSDDDCWKFFKDRAFKNASSETNPELQAIGRDIVEKCKGNPLAVKSLAGLCSVLDPKEWKEILNSETWELHLRGKLGNNILPSLWLSYHYLPLHLKRCFAYCSMFPKDYEMNESKKEEIILLWMAEGLLQCPGNEEKRFEDVGEEYFQDLISRSLFQPMGKDKSTILMHDLIHDLAVLVSGEFSFRLDGNVKAKFSSRTRHFSYSKIEDCEKFDEVLSLAKRIRSFLRLPSRYYHCDESPGRESRLETLLRVGGCLRALCPSQFVFTKLPDSIGNLKHLRYLDLSYNYDLEEIPNTLCGLYNLQTLRLTWCMKLTQLPTDMANLVNLRHLYIKGVPLKKMPPKMRNLKALQTLGKFVIGESGGSSVEELGELRFLSGALEISGLQNVNGVENVRESYLKDKKYLTKLECCWSNNDRSDNSRKDKEVLDALQPHPNLRELVIDGYGVETLSNWLGNCSYEAMVSVRLTNCCNCRVLPPLDQLPSLQKLYIYGCHGVEFFRSIKPFRSLKWLEFEGLFEWQQWLFSKSQEDGGCFPSLEHLSIRVCPKLSCLPEYFPSLKTLEILHNEQIDILSGIQQMEMSFPHLDQLRIENCPKLETFLLRKFPSNLKEACISGTASFEMQASFDEGIPSNSRHFCRGSTILGCTYVMKVLHPTTLTSLVVRSLDNLDWEGFRHCHCLEELRIECCKELQRFPGEELHVSLISLCLTRLPKLEDLGQDLQHLISLKKLCIEDCGNLQCLSKNRLPTSLTSLHLCRLPKLEYLDKVGLQDLISLKELGIEDCGNLQCLSENRLPTSLTSLHLNNLPKLEDLGEDGLQHLISLKELRIKYCENLQCLSKNRLPTSLTSLHLCRLPKLKYLDKGGLQEFISLKELGIEDCGNLQCLSKNKLPTSLTSLHLKNLPKLEDLGEDGLQHLISLKKLRIDDCKNLQCLSNHRLPTSLTSLELFQLPKLENLCNVGIQHLNSLKELGIGRCENFNQRCLSEYGLPTSLTSLHIVRLPSLAELGRNFFQCQIYLEGLSIFWCENLKYDSQQEGNVKGGLKNFISLKTLTIYGSERLLGLLEEGLPPSLTSLKIGWFQNLRDLNRMGFQDLISLSSLSIYNCANLQCLPEQGLPSSLSLDISDCPLLEPRRQEGTGSD